MPITMRRMVFQFTDSFFLSSDYPDMSNQHNTDPSEDHYIEEHYKHGSKKGTHQGSNERQKQLLIKNKTVLKLL